MTQETFTPSPETPLYFAMPMVQVLDRLETIVRNRLASMFSESQRTGVYTVLLQAHFRGALSPLSYRNTLEGLQEQLSTDQTSRNFLSNVAMDLNFSFSQSQFSLNAIIDNLVESIHSSLFLSEADEHMRSFLPQKEETTQTFKDRPWLTALVLIGMLNPERYMDSNSYRKLTNEPINPAKS